jgi:hypothetical protein
MKEKTQSQGGRLDLLLKDPLDDSFKGGFRRRQWVRKSGDGIFTFYCSVKT